MKRIPLIQFGKLIVFLTIFFFTTQFSFAAPTSLLFHGTGEGDVDRLKIVVAYPTKPVDVGEDFTIEWWMKASINNNQGECVDELDDGWSYGNILFDREIFGNGAFGSYGIALGSGRISFGVHNGTWGKTVCGSTYVADNQWHHIAVTREMDSGTMKIFVDGELDTTGIGPSGNVSYNYGGGEGGTGQFYLVVGAEKYDLDSELFPPYSGRIDEIRFSGVIRYDSNFLPQTEPFETDEDTLALFHLDEGTGTSVNDTSGALGGPSPGAIQVGGSPEGPEWSSDSPFDISTIDSSTGGSSSGSGGGSGGSGGGSGGSSSSGGTT
ncbi:LamG domain-containing protein, partial [Candidatus Dojkabacteria bacterium]|nr:LamG domain-containing protein [Candidatus Dojkabacteria bacterium]